MFSDSSDFEVKKLKRSVKKNIEPHIILHLRITQEDIDAYRDEKITSNHSYFPSSHNSLNHSHHSKPTAYENSSLKYSDLGSSEDNSNNDTFHIKTPRTCSESSGFVSYDGMVKNTLAICPEEQLENYNLEVNNVDIDKFSNFPQPNFIEEEQTSEVKFRLINTMCEFADANKRKELPKHTSLWCRWCCHPFNNPPIAIPKWLIKDVFYVFGCYCDFHCASAHLFFRADMTDNDKWECYHLLHLLRKKMTGISETKKIKLAEKQETLRIFGGHLPVETFRKINREGMFDNKNKKEFNVIYPPIISLIPKIEEHTFYNEDIIHRKMNYVAPKNECYHSRKRWGNEQLNIPMNEERIKKAEENLKIKREKPLLDKKYTLLNYMDLQISKKEQT
jgi:hypothetical protein